MITEDYCSFEVAKLLKEKGFDEPCRVFYKDPQAGLYEFKNAPKAYKDKLFEPCFLAPSLYIAMKWLRGKDIRICPDYSDVDGKWFTMIGTKKKRTYSGYYDTYEEAVEAAIKYSLKNLI